MNRPWSDCCRRALGAEAGDLLHGVIEIRLNLGPIRPHHREDHRPDCNDHHGLKGFHALLILMDTFQDVHETYLISRGQRLCGSKVRPLLYRALASVTQAFNNASAVGERYGLPAGAEGNWSGIVTSFLHRFIMKTELPRPLKTTWLMKWRMSISPRPLARSRPPGAVGSRTSLGPKPCPSSVIGP